MLEAGINPRLANNGDVENQNYDGDNDEEIGICTLVGW